MSEPPLVQEIRQGAMWIRLNRPEAMNSLTPQLLAGLSAALDEAQARDEVKAIVLTGEGRAFCAGADLKFVRADATGPEAAAAFLQRVLATMNRIAAFPKPVIAALNGLALAGGLELVLCCDLVIAARSASFLQAFSKIGLVPDTGGTWFLPQRVGMARAIGLAMLADKLPAEKAAEWGLIWQVVDDADLAATVDKLAAQLATMPTKALVRTRQAMHAAPTHTLEQQLSMEGGFMRELGWSPDYAEGVSAFMEKRAPKFTGQ